MRAMRRVSQMPMFIYALRHADGDAYARRYVAAAL